MLIYTKEEICLPNTKRIRSLAITKHKKSQLETTLSKLSDKTGNNVTFWIRNGF